MANLFVLFCFFDMGAPFVVQAGLELMTLLPHLNLLTADYKCKLSCQSCNKSFFFLIWNVL